MSDPFGVIPLTRACQRCGGSGAEPRGGLQRPHAIARIRDGGTYQSCQPDLDSYLPAFEGSGVSSRFTGSDIDALYFYSPIHGIWERRGYLLVQEHKTCSPDDWEPGGQGLALEALANASEAITVAVSFGPPDRPAEQSWRLLGRRLRHVSLQRNGTDPRQWLHRRWIDRIHTKAPWSSEEEVPF